MSVLLEYTGERVRDSVGDHAILYRGEREQIPALLDALSMGRIVT